MVVGYTARQGWYAKNWVHSGSNRILKDDMRISVSNSSEDVYSTVFTRVTPHPHLMTASACSGLGGAAKACLQSANRYFPQDLAHLLCWLSCRMEHRIIMESDKNGKQLDHGLKKRVERVRLA